MAVLIDASILIEAERGRLGLEAHVARHGEDEAFLSVVTASELLHGVHRATRPDVRARRSAFVEGVLERFPLLAVDLWLAATCVAHGLTMVTGNVREFARVPGLELEVWEG